MLELKHRAQLERLLAPRVRSSPTSAVDAIKEASVKGLRSKIGKSIEEVLQMKYPY